MFMSKKPDNAIGVTFIELMVALVISSILFIALIALFASYLAHYNKVLKENIFNQQMQATMDFISNEVRRAGYWGNAESDIGSAQNNNPFMSSGGTDVSIPVSSCILFSYDQNNDQTLPNISSGYDDERYGFRLNNQAVQARPPGAPFNCGASGAAWENVTDPNIVNITNLNFSLTQTTVSSGAKALVMRSVNITLTGQMVSDPTITKTLTQHIRIRNDKFTPHVDG